MIETEELKKYMMERLGIDPNQLMMNNGGMNMGGGGGGGGGGAAPAAAEAAPVEVKKEKTEFAVKLESFAAADKLKVGLLKHLVIHDIFSPCLFFIRLAICTSHVSATTTQHSPFSLQTDGSYWRGLVLTDAVCGGANR